MERIVASHWFALADLLLVAVAGTIWYIFANAGVWPLLIALLPWVARVTTGKFPFKRTLFDLPIGIFLITAVVGVWAAYDREGAWIKFWLLVAGILLFYSLATQPKENLQIVAGLLSALAGGVAVFFLLTYNWQNQPADFGILNRLGFWWMAVQPPINVGSPLPNFVGGILAMLLPYPFFLGLNTWREQNWLVLGFAVFTGGLAFVSLLMTSSRAAWGALSIALGCWFLWALVGRIVQWSTPLSSRDFLSQPRLFAFLIVLLGGLAVIFLIKFPGGIDALFNSIPGAGDGGSRLNLYKNSLPLLQDFIFTGGGLGAFAGLYSRYVLVIPYFFFGYSHNLFLDVALEQGIFGILAFLAIFTGSVWLLIKDKQFQSFHWAVLASLIVVGLHGLLDDALYGERGTPLLFLSISLALAVIQNRSSNLKVSSASITFKYGNWHRRSLAGGGIALVLILFIFGRPLLANWYADLGAVQMARLELKGFPPGNWEIGDLVIELASAERLFDRAIQISPKNHTALYRLGLIAMIRRDYPVAINHLEKAFDEDSKNRGIQKNLGYSYVWTGQFDLAAHLLQAVPEARNEMDVYTWWWRTQGRNDLASNAAQMMQIMDIKSVSPSGAVQKP